eukprot:813889_1
MKLFPLFILTLFQLISSQTNLYGDEFTNYDYQGWSLYMLNCNDFMPCTVNCLGTGACYSTDITGPVDSNLTVNCDSYVACREMNIHAESSTTLTINVHNELAAFQIIDIFTPGGALLPNTFITCGIIEGSNPTTGGNYPCGGGYNIYSLNGWQAIEWSYAGSASWALTTHRDHSNAMYCGNGYTDECAGFVADVFYYRCEDSSSVCDYDRSSQAQSHPPIPTISPTTTQPSAAPTSSPTNPGDLASVYSSNTTLSSSMTYNVITSIEIAQDTVFTVPGDVDIIFTGDYTINVYGTINIGCNAIDTSNSHDIGIISESELISIYNEDNSTFKGRIHIHDGGSAFFCNTR